MARVLAASTEWKAQSTAELQPRRGDDQNAAAPLQTPEAGLGSLQGHLCIPHPLPTPSTEWAEWRAQLLTSGAQACPAKPHHVTCPSTPAQGLV